MASKQDTMVKVAATVGAAAVAGATATARRRAVRRKQLRDTTPEVATAAPGPRTAADILAAAGEDLDTIDEILAAPEEEKATLDSDDDVTEAEDAVAVPAADRDSVAPGTSETVDKPKEVAARTASPVGRPAYLSHMKRYGTDTDTHEQTEQLLSEVSATLDVNEKPKRTTKTKTNTKVEAKSKVRPEAPTVDRVTVQDSPVEQSTDRHDFARVVSNSLTGAFVILAAICQMLAVGLASERDHMFWVPQALVVGLFFAIYAMRSRLNSPHTARETTTSLA